MTDLYNMTGLQNAQTLVDVVTWANSNTGSMLVGSFLVGFYIVMTTSLLRKYEIYEAVATSSFVCFWVSAFLQYAGLVNELFTYFFVVISAIFGIWSFIKNK